MNRNKQQINKYLRKKHKGISELTKKGMENTHKVVYMTTQVTQEMSDIIIADFTLARVFVSIVDVSNAVVGTTGHIET